MAFSPYNNTNKQMTLKGHTYTEICIWLNETYPETKKKVFLSVFLLQKLLEIILPL